MRVEDFFDIIGSDFYAGVPDSQLKALCDFLMEKYGTDPVHHVIAANEGNATALAAGYHLATGKVPVVYMQNSGEGNVINPVASLLSDEVYAIPCIFVIGWRGEPGVHDEPQHVYQGKVTGKLLEVMDIEYQILSKSTTEDEVRGWMAAFEERLSAGRSVAIVVRKGALEASAKVVYKNEHVMTREGIIEHIVKFSGEDPIVSTTGKASRELFEIRERVAGGGADGAGIAGGHGHDFLTVGSMGHASSIALGIALQKPEKRVWCIDGDGAALMHMGAMAVVGDINPKNLIHIVINNGAHETVGGQPTVAKDRNLAKVAADLGYARTHRAEDYDSLDKILTEITQNRSVVGSEVARMRSVDGSEVARMRSADGSEVAGEQRLDGAESVSEGLRAASDGAIFIEVLCAIGAREDLGRPTTTPIENKEAFMRELGV
ncbi:MAG: phosphonopyruvate decarboxylase [Eubacterium sp.]|nr:phosphonopyruvate decarboxylase [Eubacterium sp.]